MNIAVLGLGIIGSAWAKNLIEDRHNVRCWNRTLKRVPHFYPSIHDAVEGAETIFIVVADPQAVESIINQIKSRLHAGQLVIQSSTISAKWTKIFAAEIEHTGAMYLEAPFTGSKPAAEQRQTVFYLGGDDLVVIEKGKNILKPLSNAMFHIGPLGSASSLKLAMNMNIAGIAQILCESLSFCRKAGISDDVFFSALARNAAHSGVADLKELKLRQHQYLPQFALKHMAKDLRLALETAGELSLSLEQTKHLKAAYEEGMASGWGDDDFIGLVRLLEKK